MAGFVVVIRLIIWLLTGSPATTANRPPLSACLAPSSRSNRSVACCVPGPWHWKHLSERIGRMSRLNSIVVGSGSAAAGVACGACCAPCISVAHNISASAPIHLEVFNLSEDLLIKFIPSEFGFGQERVPIILHTGCRGCQRTLNNASASDSIEVTAPAASNTATRNLTGGSRESRSRAKPLKARAAGFTSSTSRSTE